MANQKHRLTGFFDGFGAEVGQLLHQVWPVAGDGVTRVVAEFFNRLDLETTRFQALEQDTVGAGGKAVAVGKNNEGFGGGHEIFSGLARLATVNSPVCHCGLDPQSRRSTTAVGSCGMDPGSSPG
jgi:hypothetical protein